MLVLDASDRISHGFNLSSMPPYFLGGGNGLPALESTHLLLRKEVVSSTLFDNISPDESGLRYIKPSHWKKLESELLEHPNWTGHPSITGICAGDFDGDSRPDIFMAILMVGIGYIAT